ncbi:MAG: patatin-like phospholipase family protein [Bdellovibrionales bacterium]|nr:patatin-like phospholipase family protein [Bdellovibrionales bacterium]
MKLESWLSQGPYTLALCSSFFGYYSHCGVATALYQTGFPPSKLSGSSAGALVGGALASGMSPDQFKELAFSIEKKDFWDPHLGLGLLRGNKFLNLIQEHLVPTFEKTHKPLEVAVFDLFSFKTRFINQGELPAAVVASCAVPGLFHPRRLGRRIYYDGGIFNKSGTNPIHKHERVLNIFFGSSGVTFHPQHFTLYYKNIPRVSFNNLGDGKKAYSELLERTQQAMNRFFIDQMIQA